MQMFCQFLLRTRAFYTWHVHDSPYSSFGGRKKIEPIMFYEGINAKVFRGIIAFAMAVVVTPHSSFFGSSFFEYTCTISVHAVHAGVERNVCNIVVSLVKRPQTSTKPSQTLLPVYKLAHLRLPHPRFSPPRPHNI